MENFAIFRNSARYLLVLFILFLFILSVSAEKEVYIINIEDTITQSTVEEINDVIKKNPYLIILRLNTPGGNLDATLKIMQTIDNSEIPFIGYVAPKGAYAWSAGTFILESTHIAAMAPNSVIGSCQPVYIGVNEYKTINESKILNAVISIMKERMKMHNRNVSLAEKFIVENLNLNTEDALKFHAIEYSANDINELLEKIDGTKVNTTKEILINTKDTKVVYYEPGVKIKFMKIITNPLIASLLLLIGIYAIIFGLSSPGIGAEIFGAICLILGLIGLGFDVNISGIALILLGIALIIYELSTHSFGIIGGAGIIALTLGIILLGPLSSPNFYVSKEFFNTLFFGLLFSSIVFAIFLIIAIFKIFLLWKKKPIIGESVINKICEARENFENNEGYVIFEGELWKAKSKSIEKILKGDKLRIVSRDGHVLIVEKI